jgi:hypothetical protein
MACLVVLGGCATPLATYPASSYGVPTTVSPAPLLPPNAFGPEVPHDFGSGGP